MKKKKTKPEAVISSGFIYICDPATLAYPFFGGESESGEDPYLRINPFTNWDDFLAKRGAEELTSPNLSVLPCIPFQDSGPGKGILVPTNAFNGKFEVKVKKDKETGRVTKITINVLE